MELREYLAVLQKYWKSIVALAIAGLALGALSSFLGPTPVQTARSAVFISVRSGETAREVVGGAVYASGQVLSYMSVAQTPMVLQPVIDRLGLDVTPSELVDTDLTVTNPPGTLIIEISVDQGEAARAASVAQGIAEQLVLAVKELSPRDPGGDQSVVATIVAPAEVITPDDNGGLSTGGARLGLIVGLVLGLGQALVRFLLDRSIATGRQATRATGQPVLAVVPLLAAAEGGDDQLEPYRRLRTNLKAILSSDPAQSGSLVVTSPATGDGKTTTAVNLAKAFADAGDSVLLIDANLRRPQVAQRLGLEQAPGLTSVLTGTTKLAEAVQGVGTGKLRVLTAGAVAGDSADLLTSTDMARLLDEATREYDYVVVDAPGVVEASEATALATLVTGALLVTDTKTTTIDDLHAASEILGQAKATTLGVVLNRDKVR